MPQMIRLAVTIVAEDGVDPEVVRGNVASGLELYTSSEPLNDRQREDGFITSAVVAIDDTPSDSEGPFSIYEKDDQDGEYPELPNNIRETWVGAIGEVHDLEDSGIFVRIDNGEGEPVYETAPSED